MLKLQGQFSIETFQSALQATLEYHPLLTSSVTETKGQFHWQNADTMPMIVRQPLEERRFPASKGIDLRHEPALTITVCNENTDPAAVQLEGQTNIIFEVHHSACDAAGIVRFAEDLLCNYAHQCGFIDTQKECAEPDLLLRRGKFGKPRNSIWRTLPKQFWGIFRAWTFLMNKVVPLTPAPQTRTNCRQGFVVRNVNHEDTKNTKKKPLKLSAEYPAILYRDLTLAETQDVQQKAKRLGITINDLFLCSTFQAMKNITEKTSGHLRIAVPTNLRTPADVRMPAANIVSMVFLDRKSEKIQPMESFYHGVHREMQHIKRCNLGWAFIHGLTVYRRIFGSFRKMMQPDRCWATATVSNLGRLFADVSLPKREGRVQIDESLELVGIEASPPIRPQTAIGVCAMTYADRMTINLHYDSNVLTDAEAQSILDDITLTIQSLLEQAA